MTDLIDKFDEAAQAWGWTSDMGYGPDVARDKAAYEAAKTALVAYVANLERQLAEQPVRIAGWLRELPAEERVKMLRESECNLWSGIFAQAIERGDWRLEP